jgi:hypothetical protein
MAAGLKDCFGLLLYRHTALLSRFGGSDLSRNTLAVSSQRTQVDASGQGCAGCQQ